MDRTRFDQITKGIGIQVTRRAGLGMLVSALVSGVLPVAETGAKNKKRPVAEHAVGNKKKPHPKCDKPKKKCGGKCVAIRTDRNNCGGCNKKCAPGQRCVNGQCTGGAPKECPAGQTRCDGVCVNTQGSNAHCGGCGNACGANQSCDQGTCTGGCTPNCAGRNCGSNGCGGSCGSCPGNQSCNNGTCQATCTPKTCAQLGVACGPANNGCGGTLQCGGCGAGNACSNGQCICQPNCAGKQCGANGCGGSCGTCGGNTTCNGSQCVCQRNCAGKTCGNDGCGGSCGTCGGGQTCNNGTCGCAGPVCGGVCCAAGKQCFGGQCWTDAEEAAFHALINNHRQANGNKPPLTLNVKLGQAAELHSQDQAARNRMGHDGSDGSSVGDRIARTGYAASYWGENVYYNTNDGSANAAFTGWKNSTTGHNEAMLSTTFTEYGIGRAKASNGYWYWTTTFGKPAQ